MHLICNQDNRVRFLNEAQKSDLHNGSAVVLHTTGGGSIPSSDTIGHIIQMEECPASIRFVGSSNLSVPSDNTAS